MPPLSTFSSISKRMLATGAKISSSVYQRGLFDTLRRARAAVDTWYREWRLGIQTGGSIDASHLLHDRDSFGYQPIPTNHLNTEQ